MQNTSLLLFLLIVALGGCKKPSTTGPVTNNNKLSYGDSVFYLKSDDYVIAPNITEAGTYTAFPDDLNINNTTGRITVSEEGKDDEQCQMGLRYKITFTSNTGKKDSTFIVLAGINFQDRIYNLSQNEFKARPIYNADITKSLPPGNYGISSNGKLKINAATGEIDLKASIEDDLFGDDPQNDDWRKITIRYKANDNSTEDIRMELIVYYYETVNDIPSNVSTVMRAHQTQLLGIPPAPIPVTHAPPDLSISGIVSISKPRPPCIIIVGH